MVYKLHLDNCITFKIFEYINRPTERLKYCHSLALQQKFSIVKNPFINYFVHSRHFTKDLRHILTKFLQHCKLEYFIFNGEKIQKV